MKYTSLTIKELLDLVDNGQLVLPAIQRGFVWTNTNRIAGLFDSLMQDFPVGAFMWWRLNEKNYQDYPYYGFLKNYEQTRHSSKNFNTLFKKEDEIKDKDIWAVLDGQQRINAIYLALKGEMEYKVTKGHWEKKHNFRKFYLCINLLHDLEDTPYGITFVREEEISKVKDNILWFKVRDMMNFESKEALNTWVDKRMKSLPEDVTEALHKKETYAKSTLKRLYEAIFEDKKMFYYEVLKEELEDVVEIFVRVNNGGIALNRGQLILSTITSQWKEARHEFDALKKRLLEKGLDVSTNFILSAALYCCDLTNKVDLKSFKVKNIVKIQENWKAIETAIIGSLTFVHRTDYENRFIRYKDSLLPIAYFIFKGGNLESSHKDLKRYFVVSQVKGIFQRNKRTVLNRIREALREKVETDNANIYRLKSDVFDYESLVNIERLTRNKSFSISDEVINGLAETYIHEADWLLKFMFKDNIKIDIKYEKDHIHPHKSFHDDDRLKAVKLIHPEFKLDEWRWKKDLLPNVQLIMGKTNNKKRKTPLLDWLNLFEEAERKQKINENLLPNTSYELSNFETFYDLRKALLKERIKLIFEI